MFRNQRIQYSVHTWKKNDDKDFAGESFQRHNAPDDYCTDRSSQTNQPKYIREVHRSNSSSCLKDPQRHKRLKKRRMLRRVETSESFAHCLFDDAICFFF